MNITRQIDSEFQNILSKTRESSDLKIISGGAIKNFRYAERFFKGDASNVSISNMMMKNPELAAKTSKKYPDKVFASIDYKTLEGCDIAYIADVKESTEKTCTEFAKSLGIKKVLVTSFDNSGTEKDFNPNPG